MIAIPASRLGSRIHAGRQTNVSWLTICSAHMCLLIRSWCCRSFCTGSAGPLILTAHLYTRMQAGYLQPHGHSWLLPKVSDPSTRRVCALHGPCSGCQNSKRCHSLWLRACAYVIVWRPARPMSELESLMPLLLPSCWRSTSLESLAPGDPVIQAFGALAQVRFAIWHLRRATMS